MKVLSALAVASVLALTAVPAVSAVLTPDAGPENGNWTVFFFGGVGSMIEDSSTGDAFWTVTLATSGELHVTDAFVIGDQWDMFVDGVSIGITGSFNLGGSVTSDPNVAFGGDDYSWLSFALAPGTYTITGTTFSSPVGGGGSFIRVVTTDAVIPEPATWAMLIAGFGLVGAAARRRRSGQAVTG